MNFAEKFPTFSRIGRSLRQTAIRSVRYLRHGVPIAISNTLRFLRRCVRPAFFSLVCLATAIGLFVAEENYRTGKAWEKYLSDARARGDKLTLAELAPPPVPDDQNFAMTPLLKPILTDPHYLDKLRDKLSLTPISPDYRNGFGDWQVGRKTNLVKWSASLHQSDLLTALKVRYGNYMDEISALCQRPDVRFAFSSDADPHSIIVMPPYLPLRDLSNLFELRAVAELSAGQNNQALDDVITMFRLVQSLRGVPYLTSTMIACRLNDWAVQVVWEGLAQNCWSDTQLVSLQREIQKTDLFPQFHLSLEVERAYFIRETEWLKTQRAVSVYKMFWDRPGIVISVPHVLAIPVFNLNRAQLETIEYYAQFLLPSVDVSARRIYPESCKKSDALLAQLNERNHWLHPQVIYEEYGSWTKLLWEDAAAQTGLDEATLACALERFKMEHGNYPAKLDELVPQFIEKLPHDVINGQPLHYQRTPDGRFMLYSVGWDGVDNHGTPDDGNGDYQGKDWVWQYTPAK